MSIKNQVVRYAITNNIKTWDRVAVALEYGVGGILYDTKEEALAESDRQGFHATGIITVTFDLEPLAVN